MLGMCILNLTFLVPTELLYVLFSRFKFLLYLKLLYYTFLNLILLR